MNVLAQAEPAPDRAREALILFQAFVVLMAVFVLVIALMVLRRWFQRRHQKPTRKDTNMRDPWKEAANRIKPYDRS